MIREFSVKSKATNNKARALFIGFMLLSFLLVMLSVVVSQYRGAVSLGGVAALSVALLLYSKYIAPIYYYDLTVDSDGLPLLIVRQQIGKRYSTLCRVALTEIRRIDKEDRKQRREHKTPNGMKKYSYMPTLDPFNSYRITISNRYEDAEILIEISDEMADLLNSYVLEAKSLYIDEQY